MEMEILHNQPNLWKLRFGSQLKWWILDLKSPTEDFILGVPMGPWAKDCRHARHVARLAERAASATPSSEARRGAAKPSNLLSLQTCELCRKNYGTNVIKYDMTYDMTSIYLDAKVPRSVILSSFQVFFLCFLWGSCRRRLPHSSVPSWKQRPMGAGGWMLSVDISSSRWIFRKVWSSDPDWYSNPPKLIFCDQSQIRESLRTRTEHWNQKPEVNISIKATQT